MLNLWSLLAFSIKIMRIKELLKKTTPSLNTNGTEQVDNLPKNWPIVQRWLDQLSIQNYSSNTITAYASTLMRLMAFIAEDVRLQGDHLLFDQKDLSRFLALRLQTDNIKAISAKQDLSAIRQFYAHLMAIGEMTHNPTTGYRLKTEPRPLPKIGDVDMMAQLLDQPMPKDDTKARLWIRDRAMFELMYGSGLRLSELTNLNVHHVDLMAGVVQVLGKGNKMRIIPVGKKAIAAINAYLPHREIWQKNTDALFISERHGTRLSPRAIQLRLKACAVNAGIPQHLHPHLLRHCFASHLLSSSGDLRAVQEMLGHADISTTQIYTQVDFGTLTKVYDKAHPRAVVCTSKYSASRQHDN